MREQLFSEIHFFLLGVGSRSPLGAGSQLQQFPPCAAGSWEHLAANQPNSAHLPERSLTGPSASSQAANKTGPRLQRGGKSNGAVGLLADTRAVAQLMLWGWSLPYTTDLRPKASRNSLFYLDLERCACCFCAHQEGVKYCQRDVRLNIRSVAERGTTIPVWVLPWPYPPHPKRSAAESINFHHMVL